jgi:hypothetical protein
MPYERAVLRVAHVALCMLLGSEELLMLLLLLGVGCM